MIATEKQRSYICYAMRTNGLQNRIPNRMVNLKTKNGTSHPCNNVWIDLDLWMLDTLDTKKASSVIELFMAGKDEEAFVMLAAFGMPTVEK